MRSASPSLSKLVLCTVTLSKKFDVFVYYLPRPFLGDQFTFVLREIRFLAKSDAIDKTPLKA